jgi:hypothetical protein
VCKSSAVFSSQERPCGMQVHDHKPEVGQSHCRTSAQQPLQQVPCVPHRPCLCAHLSHCPHLSMVPLRMPGAGCSNCRSQSGSDAGCFPVCPGPAPSTEPPPVAASPEHGAIENTRCRLQGNVPGTALLLIALLLLAPLPRCCRAHTRSTVCKGPEPQGVEAESLCPAQVCK